WATSAASRSEAPMRMDSRKTRGKCSSYRRRQAAASPARHRASQSISEGATSRTAAIIAQLTRAWWKRVKKRTSLVTTRNLDPKCQVHGPLLARFQGQAPGQGAVRGVQ